MRDAEAPDARRWHQRWYWRLFAVALVLLVFAGWNSGAFDHALVNVGLNRHPCGRNGFGAVFCGRELEERQETQRTSERESKETTAKVAREAKETEARVLREGREAQARVQAQIEGSTSRAEAEQRRYEEEEP